MKVALIHDHLAQDGGAEKVLKCFSELFPRAPIYTLLYEKRHVDKHFFDKTIETSIIQRLPGGVKHYQWYMPFMPMAVEFFDLNHYDLVISSSSAFSKGVITSPYTLHICYCHSPTRYLWDYTHQYINELRYNKFVKKIASLVLNYIRMWDRLAADRVDLFLANSDTVKGRIGKYYRRTSDVIYPPVETDLFDLSRDPGEYYLIGGRLTAYKRFDIVIQAFMENRKPLKIFGDGVEFEKLIKLAADSRNIEFLGRVSDETRAQLYMNSKAFIYPQEEDFGITAVESMAAGRPVIAYRKGGATETVIENRTGMFFDTQNAQAVAEAVEKFESMHFDQGIIREHALKFSKERFKAEFMEYVEREFRLFKGKSTISDGQYEDRG